MSPALPLPLLLLLVPSRPLWHARLRRYVAGDPRFLSISLDISDSGREGCAVSTLTVSSEPNDWRGAVSVAVQETRRMQRHGITKGEMRRCRAEGGLGCGARGRGGGGRV